MASTALSLYSSWFFTIKTSSKLNFNQNPLSISFQRRNLSPQHPQFQPRIVAKAPGTEAVVRENSADIIEKMKRSLEEDAAAETPKERNPRPKVEEIFAVVMIGSRQYIVFPGRWINTQRLKDANVNDKIVLNKVLLVGTKDKTYIGKPVVTNAVVHAVVEEQLLDDKVIVFKYKAKKNYRRNIGHRQPITRIKITGITGFEDYPASALE